MLRLCGTCPLLAAFETSLSPAVLQACTAEILCLGMTFALGRTFALIWHDELMALTTGSVPGCVHAAGAAKAGLQAWTLASCSRKARPPAL